MGALSKVLRNVEDKEGGRLTFYCPGCKMAHGVGVGEGSGPRWTYNGNPEKPTFHPSILVKYDKLTPGATDEETRRKIVSGEIKQTSIPFVCHSFVVDGVIQFLSDCTHELAGQNVPLPPFRWGPDDEDDDKE